MTGCLRIAELSTGSSDASLRRNGSVRYFTEHRRLDGSEPPEEPFYHHRHGHRDSVDGGAAPGPGLVTASSGNGISLAGKGIVSNTGSVSGHEGMILRAGGNLNMGR
jgi:hypothetical protein